MHRSGPRPGIAVCGVRSLIDVTGIYDEFGMRSCPLAGNTELSL
jgi:hypothetical protein